MKNRKRMLALLLALVLVASLCACTSADGDASASPDPGASPDPSASPTIEVDLTQDAVTFASGLSGDDVLLTVGDEDVAARLFLYLLFLNCYEFESYYYPYYTAAGNADMLLEDTVYMLRYYAACRQKANELGCLLKDEQQAALEARKSGENAEAYEQEKAIFGLTDEDMDFLPVHYYYYNNLLGAIPKPSVDQLNNYVYQTKHILLTTVDINGTPGYNEDGEYVYPPLDEETVAEKRALADDILARLRAVEGEEQLKLFDELMEEYSEDGRDADGHIDLNGYEAILSDAATSEYDLCMVAPYEEGSLALDFGEISDIVESSYGYHIILRQEVEFRSATVEEYLEDYHAYLLEQQMKEWTDDTQAVRTDALVNLDAAGFYERYYAYYIAFMEQYEAANGSGG